MGYDFDKVIERRGTDSVKYDLAAQHGYGPDALPMWVADMDFPAPPAVTEALRARVDHGIFGYSFSGPDYARAAAGWFQRHHGWAPEADWLVKTPGVVFSLNMAVRALTAPGDAVLVQPPVYFPFYSAVRDNGRRLVYNPLAYRAGRYELDFDDFAAKLETEQVKLFILCAPHNPVGRVWTGEELARLGALCREKGVYVVSDEIHCDFAFAKHPHVPFLAAAPELAERTVVCTAPSKTFNLAGLQTSNIWIPGKEARAAFEAEIRRCGASGPNVLGLTACRAAYEGGADWLDALREYLRGNLDLLRDFLRREIPEIRLVEPEGTYFAWLDCAGLGLDRKALDHLIGREAGLWLDPGHMFGPEGNGFQRMVLACPRATVEQAMTRLAAAVAARR